ncbi:alginate lyase family protein [Sediminibacterium roseum]|uniref:Alginate lyase family protein n=1 Tax=Sediminibacterium roseum TaxID=1978412 RepID=A0ABW9ZWA9_9BACT|nr:alginate lyase family protein [Sediminibacterium roseum]NCI51415.1 alginate lyase family protein [Sediminibacterium roseum]
MKNTLVKFIVLFAGLFLLSNTYAQKPVTFLLDANRLEELKGSAAKSDAVKTMVADVAKKADRFLEIPRLSVMDKGFTPVSGNKHDYMSQAPYFWYDSSKPNGRPYMRRDGVRNPEINKIEDHKHLDELEEAVHALALAYYFTGTEKYAVKAASLLRGWFLDADTKMNPNLNYAQGIPGVTDGRGIGLIETRSLMDIADAVGLLAGSKAWTAADNNGIQEWYKQFLNWMLTSKNGKDERAAKNNHGTWYNAQVVSYALFTGDAKLAHALAEEGRRRIDSQFTAEGKMPLELERTTALGYSIFNLVAWSKFAVLAAKAGTDLWQYTNAKGAGIRKAIDWLVPYVAGEKKWEYQQINPFSKNELYELMLYAARYYSKEYLVEADKTQKKGSDLFFDRMMRGD